MARAGSPANLQSRRVQIKLHGGLETFRAAKGCSSFGKVLQILVNGLVLALSLETPFLIASL